MSRESTLERLHHTSAMIYPGSDMFNGGTIAVGLSDNVLVKLYRNRRNSNAISKMAKRLSVFITNIIASLYSAYDVTYITQYSFIMTL